MRDAGKSLVIAFVKTGQFVGTAFLFYTFMGMFFHGQFVWVEPNMGVLVVEMALSALWLIGSIIDAVQTVIRAKSK